MAYTPHELNCLNHGLTIITNNYKINYYNYKKNNEE